MFTSIFAVFVLLLEIAAAYCAWRAISSARTSQGAIGWVMFLLFLPMLSVPMYLFLGHHRFRNYTIARRNSANVVRQLQVFGAQNAPHAPLRPVAKVFERLADFTVVRGNGMRLLKDGKDTFEAIFAAIDSAEYYILVQFYIFRDDDLGRAMQARLVAAAKRGVSVAVLYDQVGSLRLPQHYLDALVAAGVKVPSNVDMRGPKTRFQLNFRNHRKTVIVDGEVAFIGGHNVGDEYMGRDPAFGTWRDTHIQMGGPMVAQLQLVFVEDWHWVSAENLSAALNWTPQHAAKDMNGLIVPTGPADDIETGALMFFAAISAAQERVWIASPYFVPDTDVLSALKYAAMRGVDVRIIVPEKADHRVVWLAAFAYFDEVRAAGVQILRYQEGFMHQKVILVDGDIAAIGTTNMDNRSFRLNFEAMALFFDTDAAQAVEDMLVQDIAQCVPLEIDLDVQPWRMKVGARVARLFSPIL